MKTTHRFLGDPDCPTSCERCEEILAYPPPPGVPHETVKAWLHGCRCPLCLHHFTEVLAHGTQHRYSQAGGSCRCDPCRGAVRMAVYRSTKGPALRRYLAYALGLPAEDRRHPEHPDYHLPQAHSWAAPILGEYLAAAAKEAT